MKILGKKNPKYLSVSDELNRLGIQPPRIGALIALSTAGSHFVLHKLQGHSQVIALNEQTLFPQIKHYFRDGSTPLTEIIDNQLRPKKASLADVRWIFVNKPQMAFISTQFLFNREQISSVYCFRNPIALFHSRAKDRLRLAEKTYQRDINWRDIANSVLVDYRVSLASFAQTYDPDRDLVLNLECFAAHTQDHLDALWQHLGVSQVADEDLLALEVCEQCGRKLSPKMGTVAGRIEEQLYCEHDDIYYQGAGGYNYIRKFDLESLSSWKQKEHAEELEAFFAKELGTELIQFFAEEHYLKPDARLRFNELFQETLSGFLPNIK